MMNFAKLTKRMVLVLLTGIAATAAAEVVVVVSAKSPVGPLTADQAAQIFLGKSATFPGGGQAVPIDQAESAPARSDFYQKVTGKDASQLKAYWSKIVFTGKGQPPKEVPGNADVKKLVAENPSLIGYIDKGAVDSSVKAVLTP